MYASYLEDNTLVCLHGGRVKLKAKKAKRIKSDNVPIMLDNEIQGASISGCLNPPILGGPCTKVAMVFTYSKFLVYLEEIKNVSKVKIGNLILICQFIHKMKMEAILKKLCL
nr:hypothetical protein [Campylobacter jejuni]